MKLLGFLAGATLLLVGAGSASAVPTPYDFSNSANPSGPFAITCDAGGFLNYNGCSLTYNTAGIGVNGSPDLQTDDIDSSPGWESVIVTFNTPTYLYSILLGAFDPGNGDDYDYRFDGGTFTELATANPLAVNMVVNSFEVRAKTTSFVDFFYNDFFNLQAFTIDVSDPNGQGGEVPLPAAGYLFVGALGGLVALGRRRKRR
jgi:hypothetical protein